MVLLAAFLLPPVALVLIGVGIVALGWACGLLGTLARSMRIPAVLLIAIVVINAVLFPGGQDRWLVLGPFAVTREGVAFGLVSAGRLLVVFLASILFLVTTLADDLLEALVARGVSHRIAFVVLSAVQLVPRLQVRAGAILDAQRARGLSVDGSLAGRLRASCRSSDRWSSGRSPTSASGRSRWRPAGSAHDRPDGLPRGRRPAGRPLAGLGLVIAALAIVVAAVGGVGR